MLKCKCQRPIFSETMYRHEMFTLYRYMFCISTDPPLSFQINYFQLYDFFSTSIIFYNISQRFYFLKISYQCIGHKRGSITTIICDVHTHKISYTYQLQFLRKWVFSMNILLCRKSSLKLKVTKIHFLRSFCCFCAVLSCCQYCLRLVE